MATKQLDVLPASALSLEPSEVAMVHKSLDLLASSLKRALRVQIPGSALHQAYEYEASLVAVLRSKIR